MQAVICTLLHIAWEPEGPTCWTDARGLTWVLDEQEFLKWGNGFLGLRQRSAQGPTGYDMGAGFKLIQGRHLRHGGAAPATLKSFWPCHILGSFGPVLS